MPDVTMHTTTTTTRPMATGPTKTRTGRRASTPPPRASRAGGPTGSAPASARPPVAGAGTPAAATWAAAIPAAAIPAAATLGALTPPVATPGTGTRTAPAAMTTVTTVTGRAATGPTR